MFVEICVPFVFCSTFLLDALCVPKCWIFELHRFVWQSVGGKYSILSFLKITGTLGAQKKLDEAMVLKP